MVLEVLGNPEHSSLTYFFKAIKQMFPRWPWRTLSLVNPCFTYCRIFKKKEIFNISKLFFTFYSVFMVKYNADSLVHFLANQKLTRNETNVTNLLHFWWGSNHPMWLPVFTRSFPLDLRKLPRGHNFLMIFLYLLKINEINFFNMIFIN